MEACAVKLVILPGWGGNTETWKEFISEAKKIYSVECIDLPCFGTEPCPNSVWGVREYAAFAKSKVKSLGSKVSDGGECRIILIGHSFGGQVAAYVAANNPELVSLLVLVAPAVFRPRNLLRRAFFGFIARIGKWLFKLPILEKFSLSIKKIFYRLIDSRDYSAAAGIKREIFKKIIREDLTPELKKISCPTLILWGTKDVYTPVKYATRLKKLIGSSELHIFGNGGHGLHLERPNEILLEIKTFVEKK